MLGTGSSAVAERIPTPGGFSVQVHLLAESNSEAEAASVEGLLVARPSAESAAGPVTVALPEGPSATLDLPSGGAWKVEVESAGLWSSGAVVWPGREEVTVRLFPTGTVAGKIQVPPGTEVPEVLDLRFAPAGELRGLGSEASPRHGSTVCPLDADGGWRCEVPSGASDLHLHARGFASVFRFGTVVEAGGTTGVGVISLQPGASVVGFVEPDSVQDVESAVQVELTAFGRGDVAAPYHPRLGVLAQSTRPDSRGFFQFRDLRPGVYRLEASTPGRAPAVLERLEVREGLENRILRPLVLPPLARFELRVRPALPPKGDHWRVRLDRPEISDNRETGMADATGTWRRDDLRPGAYRVVIDTPYGAYHEQRLEIYDGSPPLEVDLPLVAVEGRLTTGGEPIRSRILFEDPSGGEVVGVVSDLDGRFSCHLPRPGLWRFSYLGRQREKHSHSLVQVDRREDGEPTQLYLELPDTRLEGQVVDASGRPVEGAQVHAWRSGDERSVGASRAASDEEGRFHFRWLPEGGYAVDAFTGRGSARERVEIREGADASVELRLLGMVRMTGRVVGPDGRPVVAAEVYAYPQLPEYRRTPIVRRATGPGGEFVLDVPFDALSLDVLVLPPGFAARLLRVPFDPARAMQHPLELAVDALGGTLHLHPGGSRGESFSATLERDGATAHAQSLHRWARLHGSSPTPEAGWLLPSFAPGVYRLCDSAGASCDEGRLDPGGVLVLETPPPGGGQEGEAARAEQVEDGEEGEVQG